MRNCWFLADEKYHFIHSRVSFCVCVFQEIYKDRKKFSKAVFEVASSDLVNMGISVVSYTLKDIRDEEVGSHFHSFCHSEKYL